jgi:hypothetical protein
MSTEFVSRSTGELMAVRFAATVNGERGCALEVGNVDNLAACLDAVRAGDVLEGVGAVDCGGVPATLDLEALEQLLDADRVKMGDFPFTVALGSGDALRLAGL